MRRTQIIIEDHVVPQLLTSAIEAYEMKHQTHTRGKSKHRLETFGLLWGYALPSRGSDVPVRLVAVSATVETSALRHEEWVRPDSNSLVMKRDFFRDYWPQLELIGTFHSHPYENLGEVNKTQGWRGSPEDMLYWPDFHKEVCSDMNELAHLVIAITGLSRNGTAESERLAGGESSTGYALTAGRRKLWIKGYCTLRGETNNRSDSHTFTLEKNILLEIPSVQQRFKKN